MRELLDWPISLLKKKNNISAKGPVGKLFSEESLKEIMKITSAEIGDSLFFACAKTKEVEKITALARDKIAHELQLINNEEFAFCWVVDYPMFEKDEITKKIKFSHNPFSMPQGDLKNIDFKNPLSIKAYQYDMRGHAEQCIQRYLELAKVDRKTLRQVATPCIDDHLIAPEDFESKGALSIFASKIVLKCLYLRCLRRRNAEQ